MNACSREAFYLTVHMGERLFDLKTNTQMDSLAKCSVVASRTVSMLEKSEKAQISSLRDEIVSRYKLQ